MRKTVGLLVFQMLLGAFIGIAPAQGLDGPPSYTVQFLGAGSVVAINNGNTVVGVRTNAVTGAQTPLISEDGGAWMTLPFPDPTRRGRPFPTRRTGRSRTRSPP